jgi:hypothetical protein
MTVFYLLSLLSGFIETGPIIWSLSNHASAGLSAIGTALAYQLGNLFPNPFRMSCGIFAGGVFVAVFGLVFISVSGISGLVLPLVVFTSSASIQQMRAASKGDGSKLAKRLLRVVGFGLGAMCPVSFAFMGAIALSLAVFLALRGGFRLPVRTTALAPVPDIINCATIFHQMHYFTYCYAVLIMAYSTAGLAAASAIFLAGWLTYVISPGWYRKWNYRYVFFVGHTLLVMLLIGIYAAPQGWLKVLLWILTGFCGTTEYCLKEFSKNRGTFSNDSNDFSENAGHVAGVACCMAIYAASGSLALTTPIGAFFAAAAMCTVAISIVKTDTGRGKK